MCMHARMHARTQAHTNIRPLYVQNYGIAFLLHLCFYTFLRFLMTWRRESVCVNECTLRSRSRAACIRWKGKSLCQASILDPVSPRFGTWWAFSFVLWLPFLHRWRPNQCAARSRDQYFESAALGSSRDMFTGQVFDLLIWIWLDDLVVFWSWVHFWAGLLHRSDSFWHILITCDFAYFTQLHHIACWWFLSWIWARFRHFITILWRAFLVNGMLWTMNYFTELIILGFRTSSSI